MPRFHFETVPLKELQGLRSDQHYPLPVVLIVDDEHIIAETLAAILGGEGFVALIAYDAESALDLVRVIPPELLVSDVVLPVMSGIDLAIAIKSEVPDCRVLLFSGHAATATLLAAARETGHDFNILSKPVHPSDLLARILELDIESQFSRRIALRVE